MKFLRDVRKEQQEFINTQINLVNQFVESRLGKVEEIKSILLSGSVARGTFMPGKFGGAIDITLIVENINGFDKKKYLGKLEEDIPEYFIKENGNYFQFVFYDNNLLTNFKEIYEPEKYALLESKIIRDKNNNFKNILENHILKIKDAEIKSLLKLSVDLLKYIISDYKVDRWKNREAFIQLHGNLNKAIEVYIKCLFYINDYYSPAEDRAIYFSFDLPNLPTNYFRNILEVFKILAYDNQDYTRRENIFKEELLPFLS